MFVVAEHRQPSPVHLAALSGGTPGHQQPGKVTVAGVLIPRRSAGVTTAQMASPTTVAIDSDTSSHPAIIVIADDLPRSRRRTNAPPILVTPMFHSIRAHISKSPPSKPTTILWTLRPGS
jgi:hypothetical protein